jgi:hypothetical protein
VELAAELLSLPESWKFARTGAVLRPLLVCPGTCVLTVRSPCFISGRSNLISRGGSLPLPIIPSTGLHWRGAFRPEHAGPARIFPPKRRLCKAFRNPRAKRTFKFLSAENGPKRREAVRGKALTASRGVSSKWYYLLRWLPAKKVSFN